jgi:hypothetical protein
VPRELKFPPHPESGGIDAIRDAFFGRYGGSEDDWNWLQKMLTRTNAADLKDRCEDVGNLHYLPLSPCNLFGNLVVRNENAWRKGFEPAYFWIRAVVIDECRRAYFAERFGEVPPGDQQE